MALTARVKINDWIEIHPWLLSNIGIEGATWSYDDHWKWIKVIFDKEEDWVLCCLTWK